jgi:hypothetical protein
MRYRLTFIAGFGAGFVLGARAGRERYEQISQLARKTWESPSVQQAAGALQAQAAGIATTAKDKIADHVPGMSRTRAHANDGMSGGVGTDGRGAYSSPHGQPPA